MKKLLLLLLVPMVSLGQTPYSSYYENGNLKEKGPGYYEAIKYKISAKSGLNLREYPDLRSKKIAKIPYNTVIYLKDKPDIKLTVFDTDKKTGITKPIEGEWVKIAAEFYLSLGDEGYSIDLIDPSSVEGYVFDGFIQKEKYLVKKQGLWTYYYESGVIKKESTGGKTINYDIDGDITEILEGELDDLWGRSVKVTFYKNGKAKSILESDGGGVISTEIDKNGNKPEGAYFPAFECYFLSKDINVIQDINKVRECVVKSKFVGLYRREPIENKWHEVQVTLDNGFLKWNNKAAITWSLEIKASEQARFNKELWAKDDCPYGASKIQINYNLGVGIKSLIFKGEEYRKID
tara:strand:+ start:197 stop:1243 length:1047 start_codon:yes stop_codon:yes gene_type:complete